MICRMFSLSVAGVLAASSAWASPGQSNVALYGWDWGDVGSQKQGWAMLCRKPTLEDAEAAYAACSNLLADDYFQSKPSERSALLMFRSTANLGVGNMQAAIADADEAAALEPQNADFQNQRCWVRGVANIELDEAKRACLRSIELGGATSPVIDSLALIRLRTGQWQLAVSEYDLASSYGSEASLYGKVLAEIGWAADYRTPVELRATIENEKISASRKKLDEPATKRAMSLYASMGVTEDKIRGQAQNGQ